MATSLYMQGRQKYARPQAMLLADNPGSFSNGIYVPDGYDSLADISAQPDVNSANSFIVLSDDNRGPIQIRQQRIENRQRMVNGRMRSYHVADKLNISCSWEMLPSRSYRTAPAIDLATGESPYKNSTAEYTSDGGAGGNEILEWYDMHQGSFWAYLAYDKRSQYGNDENAYTHLNEYNEVVEVFFADFDYSVIKRGGTNYDFWNISFTLEEV